MPSAEYWIAFGDVHNRMENISAIPCLQGAAGIILTGDLTFLGGVEDARKVFEAVPHANVLGQLGNMDKAEVTGWLESQNRNLHGRAHKLNPLITVIGLGGSNHSPFNTPSEFTEEELARLLEQALAEAGDYDNLVLISHSPPLNTACDRLTNGAHVGSSAVRDFIEKVRPALCLCGHIHESRAVDRIGPTEIINSGALVDGGYVLFGLRQGKVRAELRNVKDKNPGCRLA